MDWKHALFVTLFLILGIVVIGGFTLGGASLLFPIFAVIYLVMLVLYAVKYSKTKRNSLIALLVIYALLILIPFPTCSSWGKWSGLEKQCTCIGFEKYQVGIYDAGGSQCIGIPTNYKCTYGNIQNNTREPVSCEQDIRNV